MSERVTLVLGCAVVAAAIKTAAPISLGTRELPPALTGVVLLLAPALLAALVATQTLTHGRHIAVGAQTAGVVAAGLLARRAGSPVAAVLVACVLTATLRALGLK